MSTTYKYFALAAVAVSVAAAAPAAALDVTLQGNLPGKNALQLFDFTILATSAVQIRTFNTFEDSAGNFDLLPGSFDPILTLADSAGEVLAVNDDTFFLDSNIELQLAAGSYQLVLTGFANFPNGPNLADGFSMNDSYNGGIWTVAFTGVDSATAAAAVPEPASWALLIAGFAMTGTAMRRRSRVVAA